MNNIMKKRILKAFYQTWDSCYLDVLKVTKNIEITKEIIFEVCSDRLDQIDKKASDVFHSLDFDKQKKFINFLPR